MDSISSEIKLSPEVLLRNLAEARVLPGEDLARWLATSQNSAVRLANDLIASGSVTPYQLDAAAQGRQAQLHVGNYDILDRLGAGGMGTVFKARHRRMKRIVALKVLSAQLCEDAAFVQRFQREVEAIARLGHPNIVMAYDADEAAIGHFLVMEYVEGRDLASLVTSDGPLSVAVAVDCTLQAARGLAYAHSRGIVHRDIKPANLLRGNEGAVKVTDLGLARLSGTPTGVGSLTQSGGSILGTVNFMPPEQASDPSSADHRADIYALGCTLYFLLTGAPPYLGDSLMAVLMKHQAAPVPSLVACRSDVSPALDAIFQRMLAKLPVERYQSMTEVITALEALALEPSRQAAPVAASAPAFPTATGEDLSSTVCLRTPRAVLAVLVVEPSRVQAGIMRKYLEAAGLEVCAIARDGKEALASLRTSSPDAIVSAYHLDDMTGFELARRARAEANPPPSFVLVSSEDETEEASLSRLGQAVYLHKPFTSEQLLRSLAVVTGKPVCPAAPKADRSKVRILIVDDSGAARTHQRIVLQGLGFADFTEVADGAHAIAAVASSSFGLIVTDYNMPLMDGHALVSYLRQSPASARIPILMSTSETDRRLLDAVQALGVAIVAKAFPATVVGAEIDRLLGTV